ncbi:hypothetical protein CI109_107040 [Kwoniella shandongensis]|uniref:Uncharacterized protein n=1 Tax=Kwoniella shandongensis TaxID=1734106 RepID=A0A5M6BW17_9TREE|nr:uncharacterized protein CI109_006448 [Kwoniella shandongensis]KAA5525179.1 hypothetical protein CI109_006448 [Kwoniella shandongensis]
MSNLQNVTVDDFDSLITYSDYSQWTTPNPQDHPSWYNATGDVTGVPWHEATIHYTTIPNASFSLNSTATSIWIYGTLNTTSPNYTVTIDGQSTQGTGTQGDGRVLLYSSTGLGEGGHEISLTHNGGGLGLDLIVLGYDLGTGLTNATIDDAGPNIAYQGTWTSEGGDFFNGTSIYTQGPNNSLSFNFSGSALYIYGDQVNDHGPFSLYFNDSSTPYATYNGRSGCGTSAVEKGCEKLGTLKAFVGGLPAGEHRAKVTNDGPEGSGATFFDFDYVEYTTPTTYPQFIINATCPNGICGTSGSGSGNNTSTSTSTSATTSAKPSSTGSSSSSGAESVMGWNGGLLWGVLGLWAVKRLGWL